MTWTVTSTRSTAMAKDLNEDIITIATVNFQATWGDKQSNLNRIKGYAISAAKGGADIVVFPELALTGYDIDTENTGDNRMQIQLAESIPGASTNSLMAVAKQYEIYIVLGMPEKKGEKVYNSVAVIAPDGNTYAYEKIHPFGDENTWCEKGEEPLIVETKWGPIGIGICYDSYQFPELVRYYAAKGCRLYINCTAQYEDPLETTGLDSFSKYYLTTLASHVIANEIFVVSSNLVGLDKRTYFGGASMIIGPGSRQTTTIGDPIYHIYAGSLEDKQQGIIAKTVDLSLAKRSIYKANSVTGVSDFRPELYVKLFGELTK